MWSLRLTEAQHAALIELLGEKPALSDSLAGALEELEFARWDPLPDAELPWDRVEELAVLQGIGEADVVWDLCAGSANPARSSARSATSRRRSPARASAQRRR
ncbi:MAG: hypothetical protein WD844_09705 [Thermoleophilaceae bacterium]